MENVHPIEGLMSAAMNSIDEMIDVNTIIGDPIEIFNNIVIIPISKVCFGFAAGGSEFNEETIDEYRKRDKEDEEIKYKLPFGGGSGAGVSINPVAFLVVQEGHVKLLPVNHSSTLDRLIDYVPELVEKIGNKMNSKNEIKDEIDNIVKKENKKDFNKDIGNKNQYKTKYEKDEELDD